jgi:Ca2+-binding EF-hand superfamily protein
VSSNFFTIALMTNNSTGHSVTDAIYDIARIKQVRLSEFFRDHDKLRSGKCTLSALKSIISRLNVPLRPSQFDELATLYTDNESREFNYRAFLKVISEKEALGNESNLCKFQYQLSEHSVPTTHSHQVWEKGRLPAISLLQAQVYEKRVDFREFFRDFDPLRKGRISESNLRCVLSLLNFEVTEDEILELVSLYGTCPLPKNIDCEKLCFDVESVLLCPSLDRNPLGLPPAQFDLIVAKEGKKAVLSATEIAALQEIECIVRRRVSQRGLNLLGHFRAYDNHGRLVITDNQFSRVLSTLGFQMTASELELLCKKYCINGSKSRFAYREFCDSIET